jgi:dolichyl-phosphate-mannose-protein mannosyltransferase
LCREKWSEPSKMNRFLKELDYFAEALRAQAERSKLWLICGFSILYLVSTCLVASRKPMWNDELFTFYIAGLPSVSDIWSALLAGGEQNPPLFHIITRISLSLFGVNELAIRLPEVVGFWVMSLCLFQFVSKRSSALYGFAAMLFPLVTKAYSYAYEARPYGIVLGLAGVSLICWQSAVEGHYRKFSLVGLAVSLAAAVSNHYYAVLLFLPLAVGEAARSIALRRLDRPIWVAAGSGMIPLLLFAPLIQQVRTHSTIFWTQPHWGKMTDFYYSLLTPALLPLVGMLVLAAIYPASHAASASSPIQKSPSTPPFHEVAASLGFITIPVVAVIMAIFVTGAVTARYVLPSVIGFSILIAFAAYRSLEGRAIMGVSLVVLLCGGFVMAEVRTFQSIAEISSTQAKTYEFLRSNNESNLPIVASDPHTFMTLAYYAPRDITSRLVYLADPQASLRYLGHSTVDRAMLGLKPWFGLRVEEYASYVASQQQFLVYGPIGWLNWLVSELTATNRRIELKGRNRENLLFLVSATERPDGGQSQSARH